MALPDDLAAVDPQGVTTGLIAEQAPALAQNPQIDPQSILDRLVRKNLNSDQRDALEARNNAVPTGPDGHIEPQGVLDNLIRQEGQRQRTRSAPQSQQQKNPADDFSAFGKTADELKDQPEQPQADFSQFGEAAPKDPKDQPSIGVIGNIKAAGKAAAKSAVSGVGGILQGAGAGLTALDNAIAQTGGMGETALPPDQAETARNMPPQKVQDDKTYKAGKKVKDFANEYIPVSPAEAESFGGKVGAAVGGGAVGMAAGFAAGAIGGPAAGMAAGAAAFGLQSAGETFEAAKEKGASDDDALKASGLSGVLGSVLGAIPIGMVLTPIKAYGPGLYGYALGKLAQFGMNGGVFTGVGQAQQFLETEIAKLYYDKNAQYDPTLKDAAAQFVAGGMFGVLHPLKKDGAAAAAGAAGERAPGGLPPPDTGDAAAGASGAGPREPPGGPGAGPGEAPGAGPRASSGGSREQQWSDFWNETPKPTQAEQNRTAWKKLAGVMRDGYGFKDEDLRNASIDDLKHYVQAADMLQSDGWTRAEVAKMSPSDMELALGKKAKAKGAESENAGKREEPIDIKTAEDAQRAAARANQEHTPAQGEANNVQRGHARWNGLDITIEVPAGGTRRGVNPETGEPWETTHTHPYGYIKGTQGADGMHVDVFMGPNPQRGHVYVIDERDHGTGAFRQHKAMIGFDSPTDAMQAYLGTSTKRPEHIGGMRSLTVDEFKDWLKTGDTKAPMSDAMAKAREKAKAEEQPQQAADTPSAEPVSDLRAQMRDLDEMRRDAVWLPPSSVEHLKAIKQLKDVVGDRPGIKNFDKNGGMLIARDQETLENAVQAVKGGENFQSVIGKLIGSGTGKPANATKVVQQVDHDGNVTRERAVTDAELEKVKQEFAESDRTVRVVTPQEAIDRRAAEVAKDLEKPSTSTKKAEPEKPSEPVGASHADHVAIENALKENGVNPDDVRPADIARAAEIHANEGAPPADAFQSAVLRNLVEDGHITPEQVKKEIGDEAAKELLEPQQGAERGVGAEARGPATGGAAAENEGGVAESSAGAGPEKHAETAKRGNAPVSEVADREQAHGGERGTGDTDTRAEGERGSAGRSGSAEVRATPGGEVGAGGQSGPARRAAEDARIAARVNREPPEGYEIKRNPVGGTYTVVDPNGHTLGTFADRHMAVLAAERNAPLYDMHPDTVDDLRDELHEALKEAGIPLDTVLPAVEDRAIVVMANNPKLHPLDALEAGLVKYEQDMNDVPQQLLFDFDATKEAVNAIDALNTPPDREAPAAERAERKEKSESKGTAEEREPASGAGARAGEEAGTETEVSGVKLDEDGRIVDPIDKALRVIANNKGKAPKEILNDKELRKQLAETPYVQGAKLGLTEKGYDRLEAMGKAQEEFRRDPIAEKLIDAGLMSTYQNTLHDPNPRIPESRLFSYPLDYEFTPQGKVSKIFVDHPKIAEEKYVKDVERVSGLKAIYDEERPNFGEWHHAIDLASDERYKTLLDTLDYTTPDSVAAAVALNVGKNTNKKTNERGLTIKHARELMDAIGSKEPPKEQSRRKILGDGVRPGTLHGGLYAPNFTTDDQEEKAWTTIHGLELGLLEAKRNSVGIPEETMELRKQEFDKNAPDLIRNIIDDTGAERKYRVYDVTNAVDQLGPARAMDLLEKVAAAKGEWTWETAGNALGLANKIKDQTREAIRAASGPDGKSGAKKQKQAMADAKAEADRVYGPILERADALIKEVNEHRAKMVADAVKSVKGLKNGSPVIVDGEYVDSRTGANLKRIGGQFHLSQPHSPTVVLANGGDLAYLDPEDIRSHLKVVSEKEIKEFTKVPQWDFHVGETDEDKQYLADILNDAAAGDLDLKVHRSKRDHAVIQHNDESVASVSHVGHLTDDEIEAGFLRQALARADMGPNDAIEIEQAIDERLAMGERAAEPAEQEADEPQGPEPETGASNKDLKEIVSAFNEAQAEMMQGEDHPVSNIFQPPKKNEIVRIADKVKVYHKDHGWMTPEQAKAKIQEWKDHAAAQYDDPAIRSENSKKVVLSLFDLTGKWSQPWEDAGYQVFRFDIQNDPVIGNVKNFSTDFFGDWFGDFEGADVHAILAACPCTDFAVSGARHFAAKDADGRTVESVELVHQTLRTIEYFKPAVWAIENPVGRIEELGGLPPWRMSFDPNQFGEDYTKKTLIWGRFNADLPIAPTEPTAGSKMHTNYGGKSLATKNARSATPEGFAYSFFMANNAHDNPGMTIANKYDRLDAGLINAAVGAGVTPDEISNAVDDFYYMDLDDDAANDAIRKLIKEAGGTAPPPAEESEDASSTAPRETSGPNDFVPKPYEGNAYRAPGFENGAPPSASAGDVVRHEIDRNNVEPLPHDVMAALDKMPSKAVMWVGRDRRALWNEHGPKGTRQIEHTGDIKDVTAEVQGGIVLADDEQGTLVVLPEFASRLSEKAEPRDDTYGLTADRLKEKIKALSNLVEEAKTAAERNDLKMQIVAYEDALDRLTNGTHDIRFPEGAEWWSRNLSENGRIQAVQAADLHPNAAKKPWAQLSDAERFKLDEVRRKAISVFEPAASATPEQIGRDNARRDGLSSTRLRGGSQQERDAYDAEKRAMRESPVAPRGEMTRTLKDMGPEPIDGYDSPDEGPSGPRKKAFLKDAAYYLNAVADGLQAHGFGPHMGPKNRKGQAKPLPAVSINPGGQAVSGDVNLTVWNPETAVYVYAKIGETLVSPHRQNGTGLMMRVSAHYDDRFATKGVNTFLSPDLTAGETVEKIVAAVQRLSLQKAAPAANITPEESDHGISAAVPASDARPSASDVQPADSQRADGGVSGRESEAGGRDVPGADAARAEGAGGASEATVRAGSGGTGEGDAHSVPERDDSAAGRDQQPDRESAAHVVGENYRIGPDSLQERRSPRQKAQDNLAALTLARRIEEEARPATRAEQDVLAKYVGWGGIKGAFPDADGAYGKGYEEIGHTLKNLLPPDEYKTAQRSIQYAHYTAENVIRSMWQAVDRLAGDKKDAIRSVFEPGMGVGHFAGLMPADIPANYSGIEFDATTARIAKLLYPKFGIRHADYTRTKVPRDAFDLAIGNPPFADIVIKSDPEYAQNKFFLHDYFFAKALDSVRPGGLLAFVTSAGTMNKLDPSAREYLADRADLVGAIRLPSSAFKENANTEVTTDIIFLRKRLADEAPGDRAWTETVEVTLPGPDGNPKTGHMSRYFAEHPEMVLGEQGFFDKLYEGRYGVHPRPGQDLAADLYAAIQRLPENVLSEAPAANESTSQQDFTATERKDGSYYVGPNGDLYQMREGVGVPLARRGKGVEGGVTQAALDRIKGLIPIRDALRKVYAANLADDAKAGDAARVELNKHYDAFVKKFGPINKADLQHRRPTSIQAESARNEAREEARYNGVPFNEGTFDPTKLIAAGATTTEIARERKLMREAYLAQGKPFDEGDFNPDDMPDIVIDKRPNIEPFMDDQESYRLRAIEHYNDNTGEAKKSAVFFENVITRQKAPEIKSINDALLYTLNQKGRVDIPEIAKLVGKTDAETIEALGDSVFPDPEKPGTFATRDEYLSGNVRKKLAIAKTEAERNPLYRRNVAALEAVQPTPLAPSQIHATLGMPWIPPATIEEFGRELGFERFRVTYIPKLATWVADGEKNNAAAVSLWGTERVRGPNLINEILNRRAIKVYDTDRTPDGKTITVLNTEATTAAQEKAAAIQTKFMEWIWSDPERAERLSAEYNEKYNNLVVREYDGSYLTTPGVSTHWSWRPHQKRVIARIIQAGNTYVAHAVGAGKTSEMIGAGMEMRRLGLVKKPMYVVPNHMLGQFTKEFYEQYPLAKIAVADERRFHTDRRKQFIANVATEDLDAVIITHSAFGMIPVSHDFSDKIIQKELDQFRDLLNSIPKGGDNRVTRSKVENQIERLEQRLSGRQNQRKDQVITFEEMGVDHLFVDEAHLFRKLDFSTQMGTVKGISPEGSQKAWDLYVKSLYLDTINPGRNLVLASGTPVTNTMAELFTLSRFLQRQELENRGMSQFDAWASSFGEPVTELEQDAAGGYKPVSRFSKFVNVAELSAMVRQIMDVVTSKQLDQYVVRPKLRGGQRQMRLAEKSPALDRYQQKLAERMKIIQARKGPPQKGQDIMLSVINDGRHAAIDMRLVGATKDERSKLNLLVDDVFNEWKATKKQPFYAIKNGGYDLSKPAFVGPATQMIFANLGLSGSRGFSVPDFIRAELVRRGVPKAEIAYIEDYKNHAQKLRLFNDMNEGKVRILILSTAKATGINAQKRLSAINNLDPLWYPSDDEQRNGRGIRQGNMNPEIAIRDYSTKGTYDSTMWGMMERKARFIQAFFEGDPSLRSMDDLGEASQYEQAKAITTNDPRLIKLTELKQSLEKANRRYAAFDQEQHGLKMRRASARNDIQSYQKTYEAIGKDIESRKDISGDKFTGKIQGKTYTKRAEFGDALIEAIDQITADGHIGKPFSIGELGGYPIVASVSRIGSEIHPNVYLQLHGGRDRTINLSESGIGTTRSAESIIHGLDTDREGYAAQIQKLQKFLKETEAKVAETFKGFDEIRDLAAQVKALEAEIAADSAKNNKPPEVKPDDVVSLDPLVTLEDLGVTNAAENPGRRNGMFSVGQGLSRDVTRTPEFKRWFGDSKVVDANGNPLVVYHGTAANFSRFNMPEAAGVGVWFSTNPDTASRYSTIKGRWQADGGEAVMPAYLAIKNPAPAEKWDAAAQKARGGDRATQGARTREILQAQGYDGAHLDGDTYVAFDPTQIKSATGNSGAFDPNNPSIVGQAMAPAATQTPEFKRWFGNSRVTEGLRAGGKPLVVYHGTGADFDEFESREGGWYGAGIYFTDNPKFASEFASESSGNPNVMPVYLSLQRPYVFEEQISDEASNVQLMKELGFSEKEINRAFDKDRDLIRDALTDAGYDGLIVFSPEGRNEYVAFYPEQVKSATGNNGDFDSYDPSIIGQALPRWYYSQTLRAVESAKQEKAAPNAWLGYLKNQPGVKPEELQWLNLEEWLREHKGPVTKAELADYIRANEIEVKDVHHSDKVVITPEGEKLRDLRLQAGAVFREAFEKLWNQGTPEQQAEYNRRAEADTAAREAYSNWARANLGQPTRFKQYVLPKGETDYRELLLTLPRREIRPEGWTATEYAEWPGHYEVKDAEGDIRYEEIPASSADEAIRRAYDDLEGESLNYKTAHWPDTVNPVAHVRFNTRTIDGKKTLFLEEVQSDWHQRGKRQGYRKDSIKPITDAEREELHLLRNRWRSEQEAFHEGRSFGNPLTPAEHARFKELDSRRLNYANNGSKVPDAPFKTTWPDLVFKRMIRYAAEHGFDQIAWTPGDVQAQRYDLSKQVHQIDAYRSRDGFELTAHPIGGGNNRDLSNGETIPAEKLADYVGKDLAEKIAAQPVGELREYTGLDLKVGGEGMRGFYDQILPATVNKLVKKFGAKVGTGRLSTADTLQANKVQNYWMLHDAIRGEAFRDADGEPATFNTREEAEAARQNAGGQVHTLPITPALREAALTQGFPLFKAKEGEQPQPQPQESRGLTPEGEMNRRRMLLEKKVSAMPLAARKQVEAHLRGLIENMLGGDRVGVAFRNRIAAPSDLKGWGGQQDVSMGGQYFPLVSYIELALGDPKFDPMDSAYHEAFHAIEDHLLSDQEMALLKREEPRLRKIVKDYYGLTDDQLGGIADFEIRAIAFDHYARQRREGGKGEGFHIGVRSIFEKLLRLLRQLGNYIRSLGFRTSEDVFGAAYEGRMADRASRMLDEGLPSRIVESVENGGAGIAKAPAEKVISAAVRTNGRVFDGIMHADAEEAAARALGRNRLGDLEEGYITSTGRFVDRAEAWSLAEKSDQIDHRFTFKPDHPEHGELHAEALKGWDDAETDRNNTALQKATEQKEFLKVDGEPAWAVVVDNIDNAVIGKVRYQNAEDADFHHSIYLGERLAAKVNEGKATLVWGDKQGLQSMTPMPSGMRGALSGLYSPSNFSVGMARPAGGGAPSSIASRIREKIASVFESRGFRRLVEGAQDLSLPVRELQNELEFRREGHFGDQQDFYTRKRLYPGRVGNETQVFNKEHLDPLVEYMKANNISLETAGDYVYAKHVAERNEHVGNLYPGGHPFNEALRDRTIVGGSGRSQEWADSILERARANGTEPALEEVSRRIQAIREDILRRMVEGHLITPEHEALLLAQYEHYVDLRGFEDAREEAPPDYREPARFNVRGKEYRQAFGRRSKADNPIVNMLDQAYRAIDRVERNRYLHAVWNAFVRMNRDIPGSVRDIVRLDRGKMKKEIDQRTGLVREVPDNSFAMSPNTVTLKINGVPHHIIFENRDVAEAVKRMKPDSLTQFFQGMVNLQNKLKALWTHYSPDFLARHFLFRYPIEGTLNSFEQKESGEHRVSEYIKRSIPFAGAASKAIFAANKGITHADPEVARLQAYWEEMKKAGGAMVFRNMRDQDLLHEHLKTQLMALRGRPVATAREKWRKAIEAMDVKTNALDNSLRLAAYASARDQGKSPQQSALIAREATIDFQLKGRWSNAIALWFPFGNVATQTGTRMVKGVSRSRIMRHVFMGTMLAGFLTGMFNYLIGGNDTDGIPFFEKIPEWDRRLNFIVLNPFERDEKGRPQVYKIPMPYNWALPLMLGYGMSTRIFGHEPLRKTMHSVLKSAIEVVTPIGQQENTAAMLAPELARPIVHLYTNQDFSGRDIHQNPDWQRGPNSYSGRRDIGDRVRTGEGWKTIAKGLNDATGGSRVKSGYLDFYPEDIRYIFDYALGAQHRLANNILESAKDIGKQGYPEPHHLPLERVFRGNDWEGANRSILYERKEQQKHPWKPR